MRNKLGIVFNIVLLLLILSCKDRRNAYELSISYYKNGKIKDLSYIDTIGNGLGYMYNFTPEGEKFYEQEYKGKKMHGKSMIFDNGRLMQLEYFVDGKAHGKSIVYNCDGTILEEGNNKNDEQSGVWNYYDDNHKLLSSEYYIDGKKEKDLYVDSIVAIRRLSKIPPPPPSGDKFKSSCD